MGDWQNSETKPLPLNGSDVQTVIYKFAPAQAFTKKTGTQTMPDDMGGNDFGVADSSSWDDGGGFVGGAGGGDDWT